MRVLLISTYELGHQPLHLALPAAALLAGGHDVRCADLAVDRLDADDVDWADRVAFSVPMHTAMRLARHVAQAITTRRPSLPVCFYGLYAHVGRTTPQGPPAVVIAGEYLTGLVSWAGGSDPGAPVQLDRGPAPVPARHLLPPLDRYARLVASGVERLVGTVEATRGCSHRCRHCPVPVVYDGRVRPVAEDDVLADIDQLVEMGASHITFADPDFLNRPRHAARVVAALHDRHPDLTFDVTTKVEHILRHRSSVPELARSGCLFVVSAFESTSDTILDNLAKGHTVADATEAIRVLRRSGIEVRPSWLPFTPWTTVDDLVDLIDFVVVHDLIDNVDPVQYTVRLLIPDGSLLLGSPALVTRLGEYDPERLGWSWAHPDTRIDQLQEVLASLVERMVDVPVAHTFAAIADSIGSASARRTALPVRGSVSRGPAGDRPHVTEPWFCCSEPTQSQLAPLAGLGT